MLDRKRNYTWRLPNNSTTDFTFFVKVENDRCRQYVKQSIGERGGGGILCSSTPSGGLQKTVSDGCPYDEERHRFSGVAVSVSPAIGLFTTC